MSKKHYCPPKIRSCVIFDSGKEILASSIAFDTTVTTMGQEVDGWHEGSSFTNSAWSATFDHDWK